MAGITLAEAEAQLALYLAAEQAVLAGQAYSIKDRSLTRANLAEIRAGVAQWNGWVQKLSRGGIRLRGATPVNNR